MKTFQASSDTVARQWLVIDATDQVLGRLASEIARRLKGKHKVEYTPHADTGDYIVVTNVEKLRVTGNKLINKIYESHSGHPGHLKRVALGKLKAEQPKKVLEIAVKGMLPKNPLGREMFRKLKVYVGSEHPHQAQQPKVLEIAS